MSDRIAGYIDRVLLDTLPQVIEVERIREHNEFYFEKEGDIFQYALYLPGGPLNKGTLARAEITLWEGDIADRQQKNRPLEYLDALERVLQDFRGKIEALKAQGYEGRLKYIENSEPFMKVMYDISPSSEMQIRQFLFDLLSLPLNVLQDDKSSQA